MSLKRMLNDDDDVYYPPTPGGLYSPPGTATSTHSGHSGRSGASPGFPRADIVHPGSVDGEPIDLTADVPTIGEDPTRSLNDLMSELLNNNFDPDAQMAALNNLEAGESSYFNLDDSLEQWAENMVPLAGSSSSSPTQATPTLPLAQDSQGTISGTAADQEPSERVCYGMVGHGRAAESWRTKVLTSVSPT